MYKQLFDYIERYGKMTLSDEEKAVVQASMEPKKLRKRQYFLEEGNTSLYTGFVVKGALRQYSVDDSGMEHILQLAIENWWVVDRDSYLNQTPSRYFIEAWEDTELLVLPRKKLDTILEIPR